ncbi:hypothetical protein Tco_0414939 [Tanacetum coccineum]
MGDENPIRTLRDYSKPSHEGYMNTIKLLVGNNAVPLRSDTIRLVQNGCPFYGLRSEDPDQHLKDFLKLMDSLDLDGANKERTSLRESLLEAWTGFKDLLQKVPHHGIDLWLQIHFFYDHVNPVTRRTIDQLAGGLVSNFMASQDARLSKFEANFKQQQSEMTNKIDIVLKAITDWLARALPSETVKNLKLNTFPVLSARSYPIEDPQCSTHIHGSINVVTIHPKKQSDSHDDELAESEEEEKDSPENTNTNPSASPDPSVSFITKKVLKLNSFFKSLGMVPQLSGTELYGPKRMTAT